MGMIQKFVCQDCGLKANVSGGEDRGFYVQTRTMFCQQCRALYDVLVDRTYDFTNPRPPLTPEEQQLIGRCPECESDALIAWTDGDPCPACGGEISKGRGPAVLWD
jgi:Zn finger protein HypA/HybF involved in hydrogenase expression